MLLLFLFVQVEEILGYGAAAIPHPSSVMLWFTLVSEVERNKCDFLSSLWVYPDGAIGVFELSSSGGSRSSVFPSTGGGWEAFISFDSVCKAIRGWYQSVGAVLQGEPKLPKRGLIYHQRYRHHLAMILLVKLS